MDGSRTARRLLRISIAFALGYAATASFLNPSAWIGFFPHFMQGLVPEAVLTTGWSVVELLLAILLLFMRNPRIPAFVSAALLAVITVFNWGAMDIVFRDVSLALAAAALGAMRHRS